MTASTSSDYPSASSQCGVMEYKAAMRRYASGVTLITSAMDGRKEGLIATAVSSVSTCPPTLLICVNQSASAHDMIDRSGHFAVNLLSAADLCLVDAFSKSELRGERFKVGDWQTLVSPAPVLSSALASFDCCVVQRLGYESHTIFLGAVKQVCVAERTIDPLLYMDSAFRRFEQAA